MLKIDPKKLINDGIPYDNFLDGVKNPGTLRHYAKNLERFLREIPPRLYEELECTVPDNTIQSQAECFVNLSKKNPKAATNIVAEYIKHFKRMAEMGTISPNTVPGYAKPIKMLLDTNDAPIHWKRLYHMYPRSVNSKDRAYTREELQKMMSRARDITDKVILAMFSSAGFRLESWDYFTWQDVIFFKNEDGSFKGAALLIYRGDPESYWTFVTPETCEYLEEYREKWKKDLGTYPKPDQPLLKVTDRLALKRMRQKGVRRRVARMAEDAGLRPPLQQGQNRYPVKLDHGFRKYFNTMLRRAKVNYLDKEDMMGHKVGLEKNYERYVEEDFERFPEYQKAIPFLTISDDERLRKQVTESKEKMTQIQKEQREMNSKVIQDIDDLKEFAAEIRKEGIFDMFMNPNTCSVCSCTYVGERCLRCAQ